MITDEPGVYQFVCGQSKTFAVLHADGTATPITQDQVLANV